MFNDGIIWIVISMLAIGISITTLIIVVSNALSR